MTVTAQCRALALVGVAAPDGDCDALRACLATIDTALGAAFVVLLPPDADDPPPEPIVVEHATLTILPATTGAQVGVDCVYLVPPGHRARLAEGALIVEPHEDPDTRIDVTFRALAQAGGARTLGVLLSDGSHDGQAGLTAIHLAGGITLARSDKATDGDALPADLVSPLPVLVQELQGILLHLDDQTSFPPTRLHHIPDILQIETGHDFFDMKPAVLEPKIARRITVNRLGSLSDYADLLRRDYRERDALVGDLLFTESRFFDDAPAWNAFASAAVDAQIAELKPGEPLRAWVAGCATGEDAYTLAILLHERLAAAAKSNPVKVFATDMNAGVITTAAQGRYPAAALEHLAPNRLSRWFTLQDDTFSVQPALRDTVTFATHNLLLDPPISGVHLIVCRGLLPYLERRTCKALLDTFHLALLPDGQIMFGPGENPGPAQTLFTPEAGTSGVYRRLTIDSEEPLRASASASAADAPLFAGQEDTAPALRVMMDRFVPPAILVDDKFDLISLHGDLSRYLVGPQNAGLSNIFTALSEPFRAQAWQVLHAARRRQSETQSDSGIQTSDGSTVSLLAQPVTTAQRRAFVLYFIAAPDRQTAPSERAEIAALEQELASEMARGKLSTEELMNAHEEILNANEELHTSNTALESSRGELQRLNGELAAINAALVEKIAEVEATNDDLVSLINSTDTPTVFLDKSLNIRRYSARTTALFRIRPGDIGRPLEDLVSRVNDPTLMDDLHRVINRPQTIECEVSGTSNAYLRRVAPHYNRQDALHGVIVTYADVSRLRDYAEQLKHQAAQQASVVNLGRLALETEDIAGLFTRACTDLKRFLGADLVGVMDHDRTNDSFTLREGTGWPRGLTGRTKVPGLEGNEFDFALNRGEATVFADLETDDRITPSQLIRDVSARGGLCVPVGPVGSRWGLLTLFWKNPRTADADAVLYATSVASMLWLAISQTETKRLRDHERAALQELIDGLPLLTAVVGRDMRLDLFNDAWEDIGFTYEETQGGALADLLGPDAAKICKDIVSGRVEAPREGVEFTIAVPGKGPRTHLIYCVPRKIDGRNGGFFFAAIDIHERKTSEERNRVISAELDHRVKNVLALVDTIAKMTSRKAKSLEQFRENFSNRVHSLARTHTHLAAEKWDGMNLYRLISEELEAFASADMQQYSLSGPELVLGPTATQSFALALHELVTNAAKYGALSKPDARLSVTWRVENGLLKLNWSETGTGPLSPPTDNGFGTTVVTNAVKHQLSGHMTTTFGETGLSITMEIPLKNLRGADKNAI